MQIKLIIYPVVWIVLIIILQSFNLGGIISWVVAAIGSAYSTPRLINVADKYELFSMDVSDAEKSDSNKNVAGESKVNTVDAGSDKINSPEVSTVQLEEAVKDKRVKEENIETDQSASSISINDDVMSKYSLGGLMATIDNNDLSKVMKIIESGEVDINEQRLLDEDTGYNHGTALYVAAEEGFPEIVDYLLTKGADPSLRVIQATHSSSPLKRAVYRYPRKRDAYLEIIKLLIKAGADVNSENHTDTTIFNLAIEWEDSDLIHVLLTSKIDLDYKYQGYLALYYFAEKNNPSIIYQLAQSGMPINAASKGGNTVLHNAASQGSMEAVKGLIALGADTSLKKDDGQKPEDVAYNKGHNDVSDYLKKHQTGCKENDFIVSVINNDIFEANELLDSKDINIKKEQLRMALYLSASSGSFEMVEFLLKKGTNPNGLFVIDSEGYVNSALQIAIHYSSDNPDNYTKVIRLLLNSRAKVNLSEINNDLEENENLKNEPLLQHAIIVGAPVEIVKLLLENNIDLDESSQGILSLLCASYKNNYQACKALINAGVQVDSSTNGGITALHQATYHGNIETVKTLIECGADLSNKTDDGDSVADIAMNRKFKDLYSFISEAGAA